MNVKFSFDETNVQVGFENQFVVKDFTDKTLVKLLMLKGDKGDTVSAEWGTITGTLSTQTDLKNALNNKADTTDIPTDLNQLSNATTKFVNETQLQAAIVSLGSIFTLKGSVATVNDLPSQNNNIGDVYYVVSESAGYIWIDDDGTLRWEQLGMTVDTSDFLTKSGLLSSTGNSTTNTMHQSAITAALNNKADATDIPTKTSDLTNDSGFITSSYHDDTKVDKDSIARVNNVVSKNKFNMYNLNPFTSANITYSGNSFTVTGKVGENKAANYIITLQPGTYILSGTVTGTADFVEFYRNGTWDGTINLNTPFTLNETTELMMYFYGSTMSNTTTATSTFTNIQLQDGTTATDYAPYLNLKEVMPLLPKTLLMAVNEEYVYTTDLSYMVVRIGKIAILNIRTIGFKSAVPHGGKIIYGLPPIKNNEIFYLYGGFTAKGDTMRVALTTDGNVNVHYGSNAYYGNSSNAQYGGTLIYETTD